MASECLLQRGWKYKFWGTFGELCTATKTRVRLYAQQATTNAAQCQAVPVCLDLVCFFMYANLMALQIRNVFLILQNIEVVKGPIYKLWKKV